MKTRRALAVQGLAFSATLLVLSASMAAQEPQRGRDKYLCSEPQPEKICNVENTCGSSSTPCTVNIKRSASDASATPSIPNAKANRPFCVKAGTTVTWESSSKNTGFVVDFGPDSPFGQDAIMGGSDRPVSAVAKKKGCYKYSAGACVSGSVYGMCGSVETELIITSSE
jgi:plastocyanin